MKVLVVYSPLPRQVREWTLELPDGSTAAQAIQACGVLEACPELAGQALKLGIWGKRAAPDHALQDKDRLELYRALRVDPKVARRERFARQGAKGTGLFAATRAGAKAGY
ncbi:MAG: RnfH family protein [Polaromonas sp.]|nr:RnfH family protein [Polaromonas sp.]